MAEKDFKTLQTGDFIEIYVKKFDKWVLCEVVTNYGIVHWDENNSHWGYDVEVVKEQLEEQLASEYHFLLGQRLYITEETGNKWWRYCNNAKVLYGGRKRRSDS